MRTGCIAVCIIWFLSGAGVLQAQNTHPATAPKKQPVEYSNFSLKAGAGLSVVYLARNTKDWNNEPGVSVGAVYRVNGFVRFSGLFTAFNTINIEPTWKNIKARTYEVNMELQAKFPNKKTLLYPFFGVSYNTYKGFFTGQNDYLHLQAYYKPNTVVKNHWIGANFGLGLEHNFGPLGLYIDYRMRVGKQEKGFNIMDVCYNCGLKYRIPKLHSANLKRLFRNPNDRFHWF
ncbi:MAG: outer membrane beta-barrel protein [Bacteroidetes bacterium]|nr:outer membrane beta-barrel protein [Bacteroidota bacterium]